MREQRSFVVVLQLFRRSPTHALHKAANDLSIIDPGIDHLADIHQQVDTVDRHLARESIDRHLQAALKKDRVMTILKSESGTDFGVAGFKENKGATHLVFPKSLKQFVDKRVIGIDWTLVRE